MVNNTNTTNINKQQQDQERQSSNNSMSRYMKNKLNKSTLQVINDTHSGSNDFTGPTMPHYRENSATTHSSQVRQKPSDRALLDDEEVAAVNTTTGESSVTPPVTHHNYELPTNTTAAPQYNNAFAKAMDDRELFVLSNKESNSTGDDDEDDDDDDDKNLVGSDGRPTPRLTSMTSTSSNSTSSIPDSDLCLPLPKSNIPTYPQLYGRETEMKYLPKLLSKGASISSLVGMGGVGKSHLAADACRQWVDENPLGRFVVWINAATDVTLRVSYLEALQQVLMGLKIHGDDRDVNNTTSDDDGSTDSAQQQGEIIIVAELLHQQLQRQRKKEEAKEARREKHKRQRGGNNNDTQDDDETTEVVSEDSEDWAEDDDGDDNTSAGGVTMNTELLAQLLWDSLLQGISPEFEWVVVYQNLPGGMGGLQGPAGVKPYFFPTSDTSSEEWSQGRILCTTRYPSFSGTTCLGNITGLKINRLDEQSATKMLISNTVFNANLQSGRENLNSPKRQEIRKDAEKIAKKLVSPNYLDGSPLMIATVVGQICTSGVTLRDYYSKLKFQVATALEMSGYGTGKVQAMVKRDTAMSVCLELAIENAHAQGLTDIVSAAAFLNGDNIQIELLGSNYERVQKLCAMNLLSQVAKDTYSMHRLHQRTAIEAVFAASHSDSGSASDGTEEEIFCTPDISILVLHSAMVTYTPDNASTWRKARLYFPHVESLRIHHGQLEGRKQLSPNFHHGCFAEIVDQSASILQWAMKDRPAAFAMFQESLRLRRRLMPMNPSGIDSIDSSMQMDHARAMTKTLVSLGDLAESDEMSYEFYNEALQVFCQSFGENAKSVELMTLYISLGDTEAKVKHKAKAYDLYKKALELYFRIYGHNQNIYADDQKIFLAETLQKIGSLAHHQMGRHAEAKLYLEGAITLLQHVITDDAVAQRDNMANALETMGSICIALDRMAEARSYFKSALKLKTSIQGDKKWTEIKSTLGIASKDSTDTARGLSFSVRSDDSEESGDETDDDRSVVTETFDEDNHEVAVELIRVDSETREKNAAMKDIKFARTLQRLGVMAWNTGSLEKAKSYFEKALKLQRIRCTERETVEDMALTLFSLGGLSSDLEDDHERACDFYEQSLECYHRGLGKDAQTESIAQLLQALGRSLHNLQKHHQARVYLRKSLEMKFYLYGGRDVVNPDVVATQLDLGKVSRDLQDNEEATSYYKTALRGLHKIYGKNASNSDIAIALTQLGGLSFCVGLLNDAERYFRKCLEAKIDIYGQDAYNDDLASTYNNLGSIHARLKSQDKAFRFFEQSLDQYNGISETDGNEEDDNLKIHKARTLHNLGLLSYNLKQYDEAKKFYSASLKLKSEVFKDDFDSPDMAVTLSKLASVAEQQGYHDTAKYYQDQAIKRSRTFLQTHKDLISKSLLPATPEETAAMMSIIPIEGGNTDVQAMLETMGFWTQDEPVKSKTCWHPFKVMKRGSKKENTQKTIRFIVP